VYTGFGWGNLRESDHFGDPGVDGRTILKYVLDSGIGDMVWTYLAQDRDRWRAVVNAEMNFRVP